MASEYIQTATEFHALSGNTEVGVRIAVISGVPSVVFTLDPGGAGEHVITLAATSTGLTIDVDGGGAKAITVAP